MSIQVVRATHAHAYELSKKLRKCDEIEVMASSGMSGLAALMYSVQVSDDDMCWTCLDDERVIAIGGVSGIPDAPSKASAWMLAADDLEDIPMTFLRGSKRLVSKMHERYEHLSNYVDIRNQTTLAWLEWLGFKQTEVIPCYGYARLPFVLIERTNNV